jgi:hypothetical protein
MLVNMVPSIGRYRKKTQKYCKYAVHVLYVHIKNINIKTIQKKTERRNVERKTYFKFNFFFLNTQSFSQFRLFPSCGRGETIKNVVFAYRPTEYRDCLCFVYTGVILRVYPEVGTDTKRLRTFNSYFQRCSVFVFI